MKPIICSVALLLLASGPVLAGEGFICSGPDGVELHLPLAGGQGLYPLSIDMRAAGQVWSSDAGVAGSTTLSPAQSFAIDDRYYFDFTNPNYEGILARVRLFRATGVDEPVFGGTLSITDVGAWPISCDAG